MAAPPCFREGPRVKRAGWGRTTGGRQKGNNPNRPHRHIQFSRNGRGTRGSTKEARDRHGAGRHTSSRREHARSGRGDASVARSLSVRSHGGRGIASPLRNDPQERGDPPCPSGDTRRLFASVHSLHGDKRSSGAAVTGLTGRSGGRLRHLPLPLLEPDPGSTPRETSSRKGQPSGISGEGIAGPVSGGRLTYRMQSRTYKLHIKRGSLRGCDKLLILWGYLFSGRGGGGSSAHPEPSLPRACRGEGSSRMSRKAGESELSSAPSGHLLSEKGGSLPQGSA